MILSVNNQSYVFLCTIAGGMVMALVYDIFRIIRKTVKTSNLITFAEDLLYWIIVALIMFLIIYYSNDGEIRAYLFIGAFIGVVLYALMLSRIIMGFSLFLVKIMKCAIKAFLFIVSYPVRLLFKIMNGPLRKLAKACGKFIKKAGGKLIRAAGGKFAGRAARKATGRTKGKGKLSLAKLKFFKKG